MSQIQQAVIITTTGQHSSVTGQISVPVHVVQADLSGILVNSRYQAVKGYKLGIAQRFIGFFSSICGIITVSSYNFAGVTPIWAGVLYGITGSLGVASVRKSSCQIMGFMVMSIICAIVAPWQVYLEGRGAVLAFLYFPVWTAYVHLAAAILGLIEFITAIVSAAYCCHGANACKCCWSSCQCCQETNTDNQMTVQYANQPATNPYVYENTLPGEAMNPPPHHAMDPPPPYPYPKY